jgi:hypothetical protein
VASEFDRYEYVESYHEAGYDSLQTAKVLIKLSAAMERQDKFKDERISPQIAGRGFGVDDEFVTAPESQSDGGSHQATITQTISGALASPVTAMKNLLLKESSPSAEPNSAGMYSTQAEAGSTESSGESSSDAASSVIAVERTQTLPDSSASVEVGKVKSKFGSVSRFEVLNDEKADSDGDGTADLLEWSDDEERKKEKKEKKRLKRFARQDRDEKMIENGDLMPRWDGSEGFWRFFGNKLQVNGTVENVCHLP